MSSADRSEPTASTKTRQNDNHSTAPADGGLCRCVAVVSSWKVIKLEVGGHTNCKNKSQRDSPEHMRLSKFRAKAVVKDLTKKKGAAARRPRVFFSGLLLRRPFLFLCSSLSRCLLRTPGSFQPSIRLPNLPPNSPRHVNVTNKVRLPLRLRLTGRRSSARLSSVSGWRNCD